MFWLLVLANIIALGAYDVIYGGNSSNVCRRDYEPFPPAGMCLEAGDVNATDSSAMNDSLVNHVDYGYVIIGILRMTLDLYCFRSVYTWLRG